MMSNKALEDGSFPPDSITKDNLRMIFLMVRVCFMLADLLREYGVRANYRKCYD